ncbi:hypothetical protein IW140_000988 [Coemansia sp. RSA 1813]|nr:hypothetical protein EV178_003979 [Coemansia sp. RSA 1646]KAJ1773343.1 hypothetical protein LPJ74_000596 [Coemansia sp. RSA 1843]KAJ2091561.1 hypothetical protein IW138_001789 [Coemansia sp. RSA 986]KAJ2212055.1 hypothetical protein EV179_004981 [Coemansia sp. RSA 487]KAJ2572239.1 hypothetical protein IW140_000988 [Coemansia sp. RSA 1813]
MPLCRITTNSQLQDAKALSTKASATVAELLSKPLSYVMTIVTHNESMTLGGTDEPAAYVHIGSIGSVGGDKNKPIVAGITDLLAAELGVKPARICVAVQEIDRTELAFNGTTLA